MATSQAARGGETRAPRPGALAPRALEHWLRSYRRTWRAGVVSGFLSPLLYLGGLGFGLGSLVDHGAHAGVGGVPYAMFVAPGVLAATAMQQGAVEAMWPVTGAIMWQRQYHAMLAAPLGVLDILLGHLAVIGVRLVIVSAAFAVTAAILGAFASPWIIAAIPVALLCGLAHAAPIMAFSAAQETDQNYSLILRFGLIPMFLFAGTFFPLDQLPAVLQRIAWLTPLWHATQACRALALGRPELAPLLGHVAYLGLWVAAGVLAGARTFRRRLLS